jgi:chitin disaccharide deacetylase
VTRWLIVNADDLGMSEGVNAGIVRAVDEGIVTSASLMVLRPAAAAAVDAIRERDVSLGLHLDLGEWWFEDGEWRLHDRVVDLDDREAVRCAVRAQLELFCDLVGGRPTHLDSHQHVHRAEPVRGIARALAEELGVPLREQLGGVRYCGSFYGQWGTGEPLPDAISVVALVGLIADLRSGVTELGCHPGLDRDLASPYRDERQTEVEVLCHPEVRDAVDREGIELIGFHRTPH